MALWNSTLAGQQNAVIGQPSYGSWSFGALGMDANGRGSRDAGGPTNPTNAIGQQINSAFPVTRCSKRCTSQMLLMERNHTQRLNLKLS